MLRIHSIQPTWWDVVKVIQSNPVSYVDKWFVPIWYNPLGGGVASKYILYTGIRYLAGGKFWISFLSIPGISIYHLFIIGTIIPSIYLLIFFCIYIYFLFGMINKIYVVREHFVIFIFNKYLVFEQALPWQER